MADTHSHSALYRTPAGEFNILGYGAIGSRPATADENDGWVDDTDPADIVISIYRAGQWVTMSQLLAYLDADGTSQTTLHDAAIIASQNSTATGVRVVNMGAQACDGSGTNIVNLASFNGTIDGDRSVNAATLNCTVPVGVLHSGNFAGDGCGTNGDAAANLSSSGSDADAANALNLSSVNSLSNAQSSSNLSTQGSEATGIRSSVISAVKARVSVSNAVTIASVAGTIGNLDNSVAQSLAGGNDGGITWRLNSDTGNAELDGAVTTPALDYAEYKENLVQGQLGFGHFVSYQVDPDGNFDKIALSTGNSNEYVVGITRSPDTGGIIGNSPIQSYVLGEFGEPLSEERSFDVEVENPQYTQWKSTYKEFLKQALRDGSGRQAAEEFALSEVGEQPDKNIIQVVTQTVKVPNPDASAARGLEDYSVVGLVGELYARLDSTVTPGDYVKASSGGVGTLSVDETIWFCKKITQPFNGSYQVGIVEVR